MKITCLGAAQCVTGSCYLLENGEKYLVDCGMFQGGKQIEALNSREWGFKPSEISALFLTHAHIDHCGRIPKLVKDGFQGPIYSSIPTAELCKILLFDSAHIQEMEAEWASRKNRRKGKPDVAPLYTVKDVERCLPLFEPIAMDETIPIDSQLRIAFRNAGHILGSSILEVWSGPPLSTTKVVFSGDIGQKGQLIVQDVQPIESADILFVESTYGNRTHKSFEESERELLEAILYSYEQGEKVVIPAFAVERTQEILYVLAQFQRKGLLPDIPVYLDSPLAIAATEIFRRMSDYYDDDAADMIRRGRDPFSFPNLILSRRAQDSMNINATPGPAIVIAGNGMCTAGRVKHHLKHNLWRKGASVVIVGFQAAGSLGRKLVEGAKVLNILGERVVVRARISTIGGFSAHADQADLMAWVGHFKNPDMRVCVMHGEKSVSEEFAELLRQQTGLTVHVPALGESITPTGISAAQPAPVIVPREPSWQRTLARLTAKADELRLLWAQSAGEIPPRLLKKLEKDLSEAEGRIDAVLREASDTVRAGHAG